MSIRSPPLLGLALACLVASAALGTLLYHDGEIGTELSLDAVGQEVRVKGTLSEFNEPAGKLGPHLLTYTRVLVIDGQPDVLILLSSDERLPEGPVLVEGTVAHSGQLHERPLVVIHASDVREPLVFA